MNSKQINELITQGSFPEVSKKRELVESHISWVIIGDNLVYKIKKPMHYSFLDFSTIANRKYYCEREVLLNRRLAPEIYLSVMSINWLGGRLFISEGEENVIDYAVQMKKIDRNKQMDVLLRSQQVSKRHIAEITKTIQEFHFRTEIITKKDCGDLMSKFNELNAEKDFLETYCGPSVSALISQSVEQSNKFLECHGALLTSRVKEGFFRDCHGDLHSRNIFLLPRPVIFD